MSSVNVSIRRVLDVIPTFNVEHFPFKDSVLEDLNCILKCGDVHGLFDNDEIDSIAVELKSSAEGCVSGSREEIYSNFIEVGLCFLGS